jgi:hypothetical protein
MSFAAEAGKAKSEEPLPSVANKTAAMRHMPGLLPLHWDDKSGRLHLEIPLLNVDLLYVESLPSGMGSADLGLDRGEVFGSQIVRFERIGPKVLLVEPNEAFRASSADSAERLSVLQSFPESVLAAFDVEAENASDAQGSGAVLVDATDFFLRDAHNVAESLAEKHQGPYKLDSKRSALALDSTRAFPKNTEVEAILTFATDATSKSPLVSELAPMRTR